MKHTKTLSSLAACLLLSLSLTACGQSQQAADSNQTSSNESTQSQQAASSDLKLVNEGMLTLASDFSFAPFEYIENNEKKGFSVELAQALCDKAGLKVNWLDPLKFDTLVPLVKQGGKIDAAWASITINDKRKQEVDFSDPYLDSNQGVIVANSSEFNSAADLNKAGISVGVQSGTTGEEWAKENLTQAETLAFDETTAAFAALAAGKVQAVCVDLPVIKYNMTSGALKEVKLIEEIPTGEQYGIAVSKDNPELTKKLNEALKALKEDGSYDKIYQKYFGN